ncbi:MAG TPA: hypothetical protein ENI29_17930 [bacterium]|nr:hypothetical protein [bacterium]
MVSRVIGAFFLNSRIGLPIKDSSYSIGEDFNTLNFPYGSLIAFEGVSGLDGRSEWDLSRNLANYFKSSYIYFKERNFGFLSQGAISKFESDQDNVFKALKLKVLDMVLSGSPTTKRILRKRLYHNLEIGLNSPQFYPVAGDLRFQLEEFAKTSSTSFILKFNVINPLSQEFFVLKITKQDLIDMGFVLLRVDVLS